MAVLKAELTGGGGGGGNDGTEVEVEVEAEAEDVDSALEEIGMEGRFAVAVLDVEVDKGVDEDELEVKSFIFDFLRGLEVDSVSSFLLPSLLKEPKGLLVELIELVVELEL